MQDGLLSVCEFIFLIIFENFYTFTAGCGSGIINISKSNLSTIWLTPYNASSQSLNMAVCIGY